MDEAAARFSRVLREAGYRVTEQREVIMAAVRAGGGHTSLKAIYARAQRALPSLDRSSIYRTLKLFVELGLVVAGTNGAGEEIYEVAGDHPHHHLVCNNCGDEFAIEHELIAAFYAAVQQRHNFRVTSDHLVLFGLCPTCAAQGAS